MQSNGKSKTMTTVNTSSKSTGPMLRSMKKLKPSTGRWQKLDDVAFASAIKKYELGMSLAQIAPLFGISRQSLWASFRRIGLPMRSQRRYGRENHFYRGGRKAKDSAQNKLERAVLKGLLKRPIQCEICGGTPPPFMDGRSAIQAHHPDYAKPLDVRWLCQQCHHREHWNA